MSVPRSTPSQEPAGIDAAIIGSRPPAALATLNEDGSRRWLKPRPSPGRFLTRRRAVAYGLIAFFTMMPYVMINGHPAILLDLAARRFHLFGTTFYPTDTLLLAFMMISVFVTIFGATALLGRVWCGWMCPQTVYMEFVYRPIERLFLGPPGRPARGWFRSSGMARVAMYLSYFIISCVLAHTFLSYFVGIERLRVWVTQSPLEHPAPFIVMLVVTGLMMFDFSFFREQTCLVACPYGRLQSVMLDRQSLIVTYDVKRGEPRGVKPSHPRHGTDLSLPVLGDCVDCRMCVTTCPTGIDIRNGLQMECVHCAQCIDACDSIMTKLDRPKGLIRYSSQAALSGEPVKVARPRLFIYIGILTIAISGFLITLATLGTGDVVVLRGRGAAFVELGDEDREIGNHVRVKITNRTDGDALFSVAVEGIDGARIDAEENPVLFRAREMRAVPMMIVVPRESFHGTTSQALRVIVTGPDGYRAERRYTMIGPAGHRGDRDDAHKRRESTPDPHDGDSGEESHTPEATDTPDHDTKPDTKPETKPDTQPDTGGGS